MWWQSVLEFKKPPQLGYGPHSIDSSTGHERCNRVANWISLKTELETENRVTQFEENAEFRGVERATLPEAVFPYLESFGFHI